MHELPKHYDHAAAQARCQELWDSKRYWHADPDQQGEVFSVVIPPPNVTGALHLGHALNNTLQDILVRTKRMQGFVTLWMPGTDHAGIATQAVVERRLLEEEGVSRHDLGREKLVERIWDWKAQYEERILGQLRDIGASCDWDRTRFTLDAQCEKAVRETFFRLFKKGLVRRGKRLVNWDTFLQTAVSDDEVFHEEVKGNFWHIRYPVIDAQPGEPVEVTVATTRPETLLGDTAIAVHPNPAAAIQSLLGELQEKLEQAPDKEKADIQTAIESLQNRSETVLVELEKLAQMAYDGRHVELPLLGRSIPLITDEWAKPEMGSGCVKITPAHDPNDYEVGIRHQLPMINILNPDGTLNTAAGQYEGLSMKKARTRVVNDLETAGLLLEVEDRVIELAHSDRSKTPIEPYLADQWFISMADLAEPALNAVREKQIQIHPERYAKSYLDWLGEKRDWPVSRQLWWGHQIPIWHVSDVTREELEDTFSKDTFVAWTPDDEQSDDRDPKGWFVCSANETLAVTAIKGKPLIRDPDVLDTWFSSALWPHSTLGWPTETELLKRFYPTSTLVTSRDIITLWVARMVILGIFNTGEIPFHHVSIHPKILDRYGETMSKSKGNGVDPLDVISLLGADALRFGMATMATETQDVRMPVEFQCPTCTARIDQTNQNRTKARITCSKCNGDFRTQWATEESDLALPRGAAVSERFESGRNFSNKLWNATRFVLMYLQDESQTESTLDFSKLVEFPLEDRWLLSRLSTVAAEVSDNIERYHFAEAARILYAFAWDEFCSAYLELCKPRLNNPEQKNQACHMLLLGLDTILRLLHPIMPFVTEEIWQSLSRDHGLRQYPWDTNPIPLSVMVASWPRPPEAWKDPTTEKQFKDFLEIVSGIREIRSRQNIPPRKFVDVSIRTPSDKISLLTPMKSAIEAMAVCNVVGLANDVQQVAGSAEISAAECDIFIDLADLIDVDAEITRLRRELERLDKGIKAKQSKLNNEKFMSHAPPAIVQKEREQLVEFEETRTKQGAILKELQTRKK
jgi:valyl-tRNA synthetase